MKQYLFPITLALVLVTIFLCLPAAIQAQESASLEVAVAAICQDVIDREPVDADISFPVSVGTLYCFTKITGAQSATSVTHVWYFGATERARVELAVSGVTWRTYSTKVIQAHEIGSWRVDVLDSAGTVLKELQFEITK
jgi:hypothetical protein